MHNADSLLECNRCLAPTVVTAERISVPRKTAADYANTGSSLATRIRMFPPRQLVVSASKKCLAMHVAGQTSLFQASTSRRTSAPQAFGARSLAQALEESPKSHVK